MELTEASQLARALLDREAEESPGDRQLLFTKAVRRARGWVFFYQSRAFIETRDRGFIVGGNWPIVVFADGSTTIAGAGEDLDALLGPPLC